MENNHTAGTWHLHDGQIYPTETGKTLALIPYFDKENEEQQANGKLIAAAPELLKALDELLASLSGLMYKSQEQTDTIIAAKDKAAAAINKATN